MMNNFEQITQNITTKTELVYFLDDITTAKEAVFKEEGKSLSEKIRGKVSEEFLKFLKKQEEENNLKSKDRQNEFLENLSNYLQKISQVKLTLAFSPSKEFLKKISSWLKNELGEKVILDLTVNHKITGGIIVEYKGKYLDLSLAKKINKSVAQKVYE